MTITNEEWERTKGPICPECKQEVFRLIDGLCPQCHNHQDIQKRFKDLASRRRRLTVDELRELAELQKELKRKGKI